MLVFELGPGSRDIAGSAVNTASKLAQDCGVFGRIYVSEAAGRLAGLGAAPPTLSFQSSGVALAAYDV
jgi:class 3 adenylate cyclase